MELHHGSGPADDAPDPEDRAVDLKKEPEPAARG
jgi:hypothetical protein